MIKAKLSIGLSKYKYKPGNSIFAKSRTPQQIKWNIHKRGLWRWPKFLNDSRQKNQSKVAFLSRKIKLKKNLKITEVNKKGSFTWLFKTHIE